jgi:Fe-S-cluster-containing dehydrogenase component
MFGTLGTLLAGAVAALTARRVKAVSTPAPKGYDPFRHQWCMAMDIEKCIGCGLCVEACKNENQVPREPGYFRTWVERYIIRRAKPGSGHVRGETEVDSPNGGIAGFPPCRVPKADILKSFFVPKLCNLCEHSPCEQACPVGATFRTPDGAVLVDPKYCIGCGFCIQACPYGCRFMSPVTRTAEKCTLCYHRITRGLKPACVEVCPTGTRIFGDLKDGAPNNPLRVFYQTHKVQTLKPHLGTAPRVLYAVLDEEVR